MIGFVLTGHGQFAPGLKSAVDMVAGDQPAFKVIPFTGDDAATYAETLRAGIVELSEECTGVLVLVDLLGGTPFNQAMLISNDVKGVEVVTGTNLPMLIELLLTRNASSDVVELAEKAVQIGQAGVVHKSIAALGQRSSVQDDELDEEDGI